MAPTLRFLHPYIRSLTNPPRHAIVHAAITGNTFFPALNNFVLGCCRTGYQYSLLVSQWASICVEAIAGKLDDASRTRGQNRTNNQEEIILHVLPILDQGLRMSSPQELRTTCYMILNVLLNKTQLGEAILDSLIEALVRGGDLNSHDDFIALALLISRKESLRLSRVVRQALLDMSDLVGVLKSLKDRVPIDKLSISLGIGMISDYKGNPNPKQQALLREILSGNVLTDTSIFLILKIILEMDSDPSCSVPAAQYFRSFLRDLTGSDSIHRKIQILCEEHHLDFGSSSIGTSLNPVDLREISPKGSLKNIPILGHDIEVRFEDLDINLMRPSFQESTVENFLSEPVPDVFTDLGEVFSSLRTSSEACDKFFQLPVLCRASAFERPTFFSFCMRMWCSSFPEDARVKAIAATQEQVETHENQVDPRIVFPYLVCGLSDRSRKVRYASRELVLAIAALEVSPMPGSTRTLSVIGDYNIYNPDDRHTHDTSAGPPSLDMPHPVHLVNSLLVPYLEEAQLDKNATARNIASILDGSCKIRGQESASKRLTKEARVILVSGFCWQIVSTPLFPVKVILLQLVGSVRKVAQSSRMEVFATLLTPKHSDVGEAKVVSACAEQGYNPSTYFEYLMTMLGTKDNEAFDVLFRHLAITGNKSSPLIFAAAGRRIEQLWHSATDEVQNAIATYLLNTALEDSEDFAKDEYQGKVPLDLRSLDLRSSTLRLLLADVPQLSSSLQQSSHASKRRKTNGSKHTPSFDPPKRDISHLTILLETLDASESATDPGLLNKILPIIEDLQQCAQFYASSLAYLQILALRAALRITSFIEQVPHQDFDRSAVRIDMLVDCVKSASNIQVQQAALLLISSLATIAPELVLHGVMPVFTFMGSSFIRNDDEYSAHVVRRTIDSVVPRLVQSLQKGVGEPISRVSQLLLSFVTTYEHVPSQRRLQMFTSIATKIGVEQYLYALLTMLIDKYPDDEKTYEFASDLAASQSIHTRVSILQSLLDVVKDSLRSKPVVAKYLLSGKTYTVSGSNLLRLVILMITSPNFTNVAAELMVEGGADAETLRAAYSNIIEQILTIKKLTAAESNMRSLAEETFGSIYGLLPLPDFCRTLPELSDKLDNGLSEQILVSFERRLKSTTLQSKEAQIASLELLPSLGTTLSKSDNPGLHGAAISCISQIVEKFGKKDEAAVFAAASIISEVVHNSDNKICSSATLCLATCIAVIGESFIPLIKTTVPRVLELLRLSCAEGTEDIRLHNATLSFFTSLLLYVPFIMSQDHLDQILRASHDSSGGGLGLAADKTRSGCMDLIAMQLDLPQCLQGLEHTWPSAVSAGFVTVKEHLKVLEQAIRRHKKSTLGKQVDHLGSLFLKMLDLRRIQFSPRTHDSYEDTEVDAVEEAVTDCMITAIYKLNDNFFRPLFTTFISWPDSLEDAEANTLRKISLYKFLYKFFDTLKSIVTSYSSIVLPSTLLSLVSLSKAPTLDLNGQMLWHRIFETLSACFTYDQD